MSRARHESSVPEEQSKRKPPNSELIASLGDLRIVSLPLSQAQREQHRHLLAIFAIVVAVEPDQVAFFELDGDQNVSRRHDREEEMTSCHLWRGPEGDDESEIEWVAHHLI